METLRRLVAYNGWANAKVCDVCTGLDADALEQRASGSVGSLAETLKHLVTVEDAYLTMLRGDDIRASGYASREAYLAQPITWFLQRLRDLRTEYDSLVSQDDAEKLGRALVIPWMPKPISARDGYIQVTGHSAHHRAQLFSVLGERGVKVPDLDYVFMLNEQAA